MKPWRQSTSVGWYFFHTAAHVIERRLGISGGVSERILRELCTSGDIRSMQTVESEDGRWVDELIKPSEWARDQMDIEWLRRDDVREAQRNTEEETTFDLEEGEEPGEVYEPIHVYVNGDDFRHWLNKQPISQSQPTVRPRRGKAPLIIDYLREMYPNGVPDPADCSRKTLRATLLAKDKRLDPLDEATLKSAIDEFNLLLIGNDPT
jgi:hypothetical protein